MTMNLESTKSNTKTKTPATRSPIPATFGLHQRRYHRITCRLSFLIFGLHQHGYRQVIYPLPTSAIFGLHQLRYYPLPCTPTPAIFGLYQHRYYFVTCSPYLCDLRPIPISLYLCDLPSCQGATQGRPWCARSVCRISFVRDFFYFIGKKTFIGKNTKYVIFLSLSWLPLTAKTR